MNKQRVVFLALILLAVPCLIYARPVYYEPGSEVIPQGSIGFTKPQEATTVPVVTQDTKYTFNIFEGIPREYKAVSSFTSSALEVNESFSGAPSRIVERHYSIFAGQDYLNREIITDINNPTETQKNNLLKKEIVIQMNDYGFNTGKIERFTYGDQLEAQPQGTDLIAAGKKLIEGGLKFAWDVISLHYFEQGGERVIQKFQPDPQQLLP